MSACLGIREFASDSMNEASNLERQLVHSKTCNVCGRHLN